MCRKIDYSFEVFFKSFEGLILGQNFSWQAGQTPFFVDIVFPELRVFALKIF